MGQGCCKRREVQKVWKAYSDREEEVLPCSTAAERRRRGVTTTSLDASTLLEMAVDDRAPRRAEHAVQELRRRGYAVSPQESGAVDIFVDQSRLDEFLGWDSS